MALSWVDNGYYTPDVWTYVNVNDAGGWNGSTNIWVRSGPSTTGTTQIQRYSRGIGSRVNVYDYSGAGTTSNPIWIYYDYKNDGSSRGWSATWSAGFTYFEPYSWGSWVDSGYWSGTAWAYYYYPNAGSTTYTRQASASRSSPSFTLRASPGSNTVDSGSTTITLTVNYNNGNANATQNGTKFTRTVYSFSGWDEKTSASAPGSLTAGTSDYSAGYSRSDTRDLYYYADYTSSASTQYSNNTKSLGTPSKASTSTTYTITYAPNGGTVSPTSKTTSSTTTYTFSQWTGSTGVTINSSKVATFTQTGTATASYTSSTGAVTAVTLPTPTRSNYIFNGWLAPNGQTYAAGASYTPTSTTETLTAQWTLNQVTLTLVNSEGWTGTYAPTGGGTLTPGASITLNQPLKSGWHFVNWTNASGTSLSTSASFSTTAPTSSTTYTANVARNTYKVRYDANGGTGSMSETSHTYGIGSNLRTNTFTKNGSTFAGWSTSATATSATYTDGQSVSDISITHGSIVTLYAVWRAATNMYICTKVNNVLTWVPALKYVYTTNAPAPAPTPTANLGVTWPTSNMTFTYNNSAWTTSNNTFTVTNSGDADGTIYLQIQMASGYTGLTPVIKQGTTTVTSGNNTSTALTVAAGATSTFTVSVSGTPSADASNVTIGTVYVSGDGNLSSSKTMKGTITLPATPSITNGYTVSAVSGSTYTYTKNGDYYQSNNAGVDSSYALAKVDITTDGTKYVVIEYITSSEPYYDYTLVSKINTALTTSASPDSSSNTINTRPIGYRASFTQATKKYSYGKLSAGNHYLYIKYIKDSSGANGTDCSKFKIHFLSSLPSVLESSYSVTNKGSYGFTSTGDGYYYSNNNGVDGSAAVAQVTVNANGVDRIYIDLYQSGEVNCDYGLVSNLGATLTTTNAADTSNVLKNCQSMANHTVESVDLGVLSMGTYTFYIKFKKDGSIHRFDDCLQFRVRCDSDPSRTPTPRRESVTVEQISSTYTFSLNASGYYESTNKGVSSTAAVAKVTVISPSSRYIIIDAISNGEEGYDYGLISTRGATLSTSTTKDSSNILADFQYNTSAAIRRYDLGQGNKLSGIQTFYVKYRKDGDTDVGSDSLQFKVNFLSTLPTVMNSSASISAVGSYYYVEHPSTPEWYVPNNRGKNNTAAVSKFTITANGLDNVYLRYYQSSERNYDYGVYSAVNGSALSTSNSADSGASNLYGVSGSGYVNLGKLSAGTHTIYVKYLKDTSQHTNDDVCAFAIDFNRTSADWYAMPPATSSYTFTNVGSYPWYATGDTAQWQYGSYMGLPHNSASVGYITVTCNGTDHLYIDGFSGGETNWDYGLVGTLNGAAFSTSNSADTTNVACSFKSYSYGSIVTIDYGIPAAGTYTIYVKYLKDGSVSNYEDVFFINVRFNGSAPTSPPAAG